MRSGGGINDSSNGDASGTNAFETSGGPGGGEIQSEPGTRAKPRTVWHHLLCVYTAFIFMYERLSVQ